MKHAVTVRLSEDEYGVLEQLALRQANTLGGTLRWCLGTQIRTDFEKDARVRFPINVVERRDDGSYVLSDGTVIGPDGKELAV